MTKDSKVTEESFTLVTSQRKNKKKNTNKRTIQNFSSTVEDSVDEVQAIK